MEIGKLRHKVSLFQKTVTYDEIGQAVAGYTYFSTAWAAVEPLSFKEYLAAGSERASKMVRIKLRYLPNISADMRVVYEEHTYEILSVLDKELRHIELELLCEERL
jgi:SPP1 family predicted phage head-tail adaptor